ncbi:MAG: heme exporter protein CcmD [Lysobacteraceae bacterium]
MTYLPYIIAAYAVFAIVLAWDALTPWLRQRQLLRKIRLRALRDESRNPASASDPAQPVSRLTDPVATDKVSDP